MSEKINTIILKNSDKQPSEGVLQKAEPGFDTTHKVLFVGDSNSNPIPINPIISETDPGLNIENLLWIDPSEKALPLSNGGTGFSANSLSDL